MGIIAIFSVIAFVVLIACIIFAERKGTKISCAIAAAIVCIVAVAGFWMENYSGNHPKVTVETYKTFSIDLYNTNIKFNEPVLVRETTTRYGLASIFHDGSTVYEVTPLEE